MNLTETDLCQLNLLFRNNHFGFIASTSSPARVYAKAKINGTSIFSRENKRVKRHNSFTVSFTKTVLDDGPYYCVVEKFVSVCGQNVAFITELAITGTGPPSDLLGVMTLETKACLFEEYLAYNENEKMCILVNQINNKCINLSTENWKLLTNPVNSIECE